MLQRIISQEIQPIYPMQIVIKQIRILVSVAIDSLEERLEHEFCLTIFVSHRKQLHRMYYEIY